MSFAWSDRRRHISRDLFFNCVFLTLTACSPSSGELADFRAQFDNLGNSLGNKIYIIKPDTGCQGRGIFLTRTFDLVPHHENVVAQLYIKKPLLLDGYKFDLRIYCLVSSVKPLRMYLFHDGLVRLCTEEYVAPTRQNISNTCMHLTNYAVNKNNSNFQVAHWFCCLQLSICYPIFALVRQPSSIS